jgi:poly-gamma-glutamate synthesis protein (capsule biosynthesis protein)
MHGAPLLHGVEIYGGRPIFYDLGNFILQSPTALANPHFWEPTVWESVVVKVDFAADTVASIVFRPIALDPYGQGEQGEGESAAASGGLPVVASGEKAQHILARLVEASRPFGTEIVIKGDTAELVMAGVSSRPM